MMNYRKKLVISVLERNWTYHYSEIIIEKQNEASVVFERILVLHDIFFSGLGAYAYESFILLILKPTV
ncbi:hypothetical protein CRYUN_Cryun28dG0116500 [Craigia yunnanensis]